MKYTNDLNLPAPFVNLVKFDDYPSHKTKDGRFKIGVTGLLNPPQQIQLKRRYRKDIVTDVSELLWAAFGKAMHYALYRANKTGIAEHRVDAEVNGCIVSGQFDRVSSEASIDDYKVTSIYSAHSDDTISKWADQINMYYWLAIKDGITVKKARIIAFLRDFSMRHKYDSSMPNKPVLVVNIELRSLESIERFIKERLALHEAAVGLADDDLPPCSIEDQWRSQDLYKIKKKGVKKAIRNLHSEKEAMAYAIDKKLFADGEWKKGHYIHFEKGYARKCEEYCEVKMFCSQYKREHNDSSLNNEGIENEQA